MTPITHAVVLFSGFLQKYGNPGSGFVDLAHRAHELVFAASRPGWRVCLYPWNTDISDVAESLWRYRPDEKEQIQLVAGYSYGGNAAVRYLWELEKRGGVAVHELALCDSIRRWKWLPGVAAALPWPKLHVPEGTRCWWYRRKGGRLRFAWPPFDPRGHEVTGSMLTEPVIEKSAGHLWIDNDYTFHRRFLQSVKKLIEDDQCAV